MSWVATVRRETSESRVSAQSEAGAGALRDAVAVDGRVTGVLSTKGAW